MSFHHKHFLNFETAVLIFIASDVITLYFFQSEHPWLKNSTVSISAWNASTSRVNIFILDISLNECHWNVSGISIIIQRSNLLQMSLTAKRNDVYVKTPEIIIQNSTIAFLNVSSVNLHLSNCYFEYNKIQGMKGFIIDKSYVVISSSSFQKFEGRSRSDSWMVATNSNLKFINLTFVSNSVNETMISIIKSNLTISNGTFLNNESNRSAILYAKHQSNVRVVSSSFRNNKGVVGAALRIQDRAGIEVQNSSFVENTAVFGSAITAQVHSFVFVNCSNFTKNYGFNGLKTANDPNDSGGSIMVRSFVTLKIYNSSFSGNSAAYGGAISITWNSNLSINMSYFDSNHGVQGGAINAHRYVVITLIGSSFLTNRATEVGGALDCSHYSIIQIKDVIFKGNCGYAGGAINVNSNVEMNLTRTTFIHNVAFTDLAGSNGNGGAISASESVKLETHNCSFRCNLAAHSGGAISTVYNSHLYVHSSVFKNNSAFESEKIEASFLLDRISRFLIQRNTDQNITDGIKNDDTDDVPCIALTQKRSGTWNANTDGGAISVAFNSTIQINHSNFSGNMAYSGGSLRFEGGVTGKVRSSFFENNKAVEGSAFYISETADVQISETIFNQNAADLGNLLLSSKEGISISFRNCTFKANIARRGGVLLAESVVHIMFENCTFFRNKATDSSGVFKVSGDRTNNVWLYIVHCLFEENRAQDTAGVFRLYGSNVHIKSSQFSKNRAGNLGGVFMGRSVNVSIWNSNFTHNVAVHNAACFYYETDTDAVKFEVIGCTFTNNHAGSYGAVMDIFWTRNIAFESCTFRNNTSALDSSLYLFGARELKLSRCNFYSANVLLPFIYFAHDPSKIVTESKTYKVTFHHGNATYSTQDNQFLEEAELKGVMKDEASALKRLTHEETIFASGRLSVQIFFLNNLLNCCPHSNSYEMCFNTTQ